MAQEIGGLSAVQWEALYDKDEDGFSQEVKSHGLRWAQDTEREGRCIECGAPAGIYRITVWKQGEEGYISFARRDFGCGH